MSESTNAELDLLETKSQFEKFVIYLPTKFFNKSSLFKNIYQRIRKKLRYKGIMTHDIDEYAKNLSRLNNYCNSIKDNLLTIANEFEHHPDVSINYLLKNKFSNEFIKQKFDDLDYPSANVLYIHLYGGYYYNDKIYAKKKFDIERELLFFIAGNLGVGKITYNITNKETVITKIKSDANIRHIKNQIQFSKTYEEKKSSECTEIYENNGAPILFDANGDIKKLEKEIKKSLEPINSPIFNYGFYKSNPKMVAFVCKRFLFKMNTLDYTSESEDVSEMSLTVQSCFADYGLQIAFESSTINTEKVTYKLEFHNENNLLETYFQKNKYNDSATDPFVMIRKFYDKDKSGNKEDSKNMIKKYIIGLADNCEYKIKDSSTTHTFSKKFDDFIQKSEVKLSIKYKNFYTTRDIKKWFVDNLLIRSKEEVASDFFDNSDYKANGDEVSSNLVKTYEEKIAYLESQLKDTTYKLNIFQSQNTEYARRLELEQHLKEAREQQFANLVSNEMLIPSIEKPLNTIRNKNYEHNYSSIQQLNEVRLESSLPEPSLPESSLPELYSRECSPISLLNNQSVVVVESSELPSEQLEQQSPTQFAELRTSLVPSPAPSLTLSQNSLVSINSISSINPLQLTYPIASNNIFYIDEPKNKIQNSKTVEELLKENEDKLNHYKELHKTLETMKIDIKNKREQLEKSKNANKDKMTEQLIELSSSQNTLQSLRSRRVMEQIKQTSSNKNLDDDYDAFDKLKGIFTRANATVNNIDKQICKAADKCKKIEDQIACSKYELDTKQNEIEQLTYKYDENLEEKSKVEEELLNNGFTIEQLNDIIMKFQFQIQISNVTEHLGNGNSIGNCNSDSNEPRSSYISLNGSKNPIHSKTKNDKYFSRTFSNRSHECFAMSSV